MSYITFNNGALASTPATGKAVLATDPVGKIYKIDDKGVIAYLGDQDLSNWLRNSGFWFAQRQTPGTLTTYSNTTGRAFTADGWAITNENASVQYGRTNTASAPEVGLQAQYYGTYVKITSLGKMEISQCIESKEVMNLRGRTVRFQLWMKGLSGSQTVRIGLIQLTSAGTADTLPATFISAQGANGTDPTLGTNLAYITPKSGVTPENGVVSGNAVSCTVTNAGWQRYGAVFDVPTNCLNLIVMVWSNSQVAPANGIAIAQASLTDGYEIQDWSPLDYGTELQRVLRFYCKSFPLDTAPAQNTGSQVGIQIGIANVAGAATSTFSLRWPVKMRTTPTILYYNPNAANAFVRGLVVASDASTATAANQGEDGTFVSTTGNAGWAVGTAIGVHFSADAEL